MALNQLASGSLAETMAAAKQLFAGEAPIISDSAPALANVQMWQLCALTATGIRPFVWTNTPASDDAPRTAVITAIGGTTGKQIPYYDAGKFNHEVVVWPAALDTLAKRKAAMHGSMLHFGHLI